MKNRNAGYSLIELIVVIAVMVILGAVGAGWIVRISGYRVRETTSKVTNSLNAAKIKVMSKERNEGEGYWKLERDSNDDFYYVSIVTPIYESSGTITENVERTKVSRSKIVTVSYTTVDNSTPTEITSGSALYLSWKRSSGASVFGGSTGATWNTNVAKGVDSIIVSGGGKSYTITLVPMTGKVMGRN